LEHNAEMEITDLSPIIVLFAVAAMVGIFVFFGRIPSRWSQFLVRIVSAVGTALGCSILALLILKGKPEEHVVELQNRSFKIMVRSQEFLHSGTRNIDICVAEVSSRVFPRKRMQCFLHGFDFSGLSVAWLSERDIEVSFRSGYLTEFSNSASVSTTSNSVQGFHVLVREGERDVASEILMGTGKVVSRLNIEF
jgi:hypothetical protein